MRRRSLLLTPGTLLARRLHAEELAPQLVPPAGARLPLDLAVRDADGHALTMRQALGGLPTAFVFADYGCAVLCGTALGLAAAMLPATGLRPGEDYRLVVLGLNPQDGPSLAAAKQHAWLGEETALATTARFLVTDALALETAMQAFGYRVRKRADGIDHPLALLILRSDGTLAATLPALGTEPEALRAALQRATPEWPALLEPVRLLCRAGGLGAARFPLRGILAASGAATLVVLGGTLVLLRRRETRP